MNQTSLNTKPLGPGPVVVLVDDDEGLGASLRFLLEAERIVCEHFLSGKALLQALKQKPRPAWLDTPGCVLLDVRMPGENGTDVFEQIKRVAPELALPVVFMTGHGDVPLVTRVLKEGAFDFIQKPIEGEALLARLSDYFKESSSRLAELELRHSVEEKITTLTEREREVMWHLYLGQSNKDIAEKLGNSVRTIELRRATIYDKMGVKNTVEMARLLERIGWQAQPNGKSRG